MPVNDCIPQASTFFYLTRKIVVYWFLNDAFRNFLNFLRFLVKGYLQPFVTNPVFGLSFKTMTKKVCHIPVQHIKSIDEIFVGSKKYYF